MPFIKLPRHTALFALLLTVFSAFSIANDGELSAQNSYQAFSALPAYYMPALSPDGNRIAFEQNVSADEAYSMLATYDIAEGKRVYINQINITGNSRTKDEVVRKLLNSADEIDSKNKTKYHGKLGSGRINALKALQ